MMTRTRLMAAGFGGLATVLLSVGLSAPSAPADATPTAPTAAAVAAYEARVILLINVVRATNRSVALTPASCPQGYADRFAAGLANTGYFYHQSMYALLRGCPARRAAENLARGNASADAMYVAWMRSPGHRANILDPNLTRIGVAAVFADGQWTVVADFTRP